MKQKRLFLLCVAALLATVPTLAQYGETPPLHVDGKYLKDPHGNVVNLHGVMDTPNPYFNSYRWGTECSTSTVRTCQNYFTNIFKAITDTTQGAWCDIFRLHLDPCWTNDPNKTSTGDATGEANISRYSSSLLKSYLKLLFFPIAKSAVKYGLYVVMRPPGVCPDEIQVGGEYQDYLLDVWDVVSSNDSIKKYSGQISLELANEPITCLDEDGNESAAALHDFFQPIVDKIRANGYTGVVWIPGTGYQSHYENFVMYPIEGYNIGYAVHTYPGWYGASDESCDADEFIAQWGSQVPVAETNPIFISETDWSPVVSTDEDGTTTNHGTWGTASTSKWGVAYKALLDYYGNISMTLTSTDDYIDVDEYLNSKTVTPAFDADPECCAQACFEWYAEYAQTDCPRPDYTRQYTADNGMGKFTNPLINADFPDPDIIRVDDVYYMVSTTMFYFPGATILKSYDLVNWEYCANPLQQIGNSDPYNLVDGYNHYAGGQWAASLKYHNGTFYLHFIAYDHDEFQDGGGFLLTADDPEGTWEMKELNGFYYDAGLLFDDDDAIYIAYGIGEISVAQLDEDFNEVKSETVITVGNGCEGSHMYHIGDYYYIYATYGGTEGSQTIFRATSPFGPYEEHDGRLFENQSIHQGGLVETQTGEWWTILFKDAGTIGRIPYLEPVVWADGWPTLGNDGIDVSKDGAAYTKPDVGQGWPKTYLPTNDTFTDASLGMQWQWNHNAVASGWSLFDNPGALRLYTVSVTDDLKQAQNTLTQRIFGYDVEGTDDDSRRDSYGTVRLDVSGMKDGDVCGLCVFQDPYGYIGVKMEDGVRKPVYYRSAYTSDGVETAAEETEGDALASDTVYLRAVVNFGTDKVNFYYSTDNATYESFGNEWEMRYTLDIFTGNRFGIFNYATQATGGHVDVDWFSTEPEFSEEKYFSEGTLNAFTEEDLTMVSLAFAKDTVQMITGERYTMTLTATYESGRTENVAADCEMSFSESGIASVTNGSLYALADGTVTVTARYTDFMGNTMEATCTGIFATFPLTEECFNPSIYSTGTFVESTGCLTTGQWGFGGWSYTSGIDMSAYKYLVVRLKKSASCSPSFRLFDNSSYWSEPYKCDMGTSTSAVIDLQNMVKDDDTVCDPSHIYIAGFWTTGGSSLYIKEVFLSDDGETPTAVLSVDADGALPGGVRSETYYSPSGQMLAAPQRGMYIVRRVMDDGSVTVAKEIYR